jgi:hypothetical protein
MADRRRTPNEIAQQVVPLILLGVGLVTTNNAATILADESTTLGTASNPLRTIFGQAFSGSGKLGIHPLFDLLLHFWLRATGGNFVYLRIPSSLFFLAGLFLLGRASRYFTGSSGGTAVIWVGILWPFAFHYARLAVWYSFSFFLVAGLTLSYFKYLEDRTFRRWAALFLFCACLIWTSYLGWAILACLAIDQILRFRSKEPAATAKVVIGTAALLFVVFLPLFLFSTFQRMVPHERALAILAGVAYNVFSFFVSESVAPWYWWLSVPAALAIVFCMVLVVRWIPRPARRFLLYSALIAAVMALAGALQPKQLLFFSPWILMPAGVAIEAAKPRWATYGLAAALLIIGAAGWYGIYSRRFYSAPQFLEPWQEIAGDAAAKINTGATVISDRPTFLFYLTYILRVPRVNGPWEFAGVLPDQVKNPQVFSPADWLTAERPPSGKIVLIRDGGEPKASDPNDQVARQLDQTCGSISSRLRMRDEGYAWKQRYLPQFNGPQWRIEIREYDCDSSNSKQIYRIPPQ